MSFGRSEYRQDDSTESLTILSSDNCKFQVSMVLNLYLVFPGVVMVSWSIFSIGMHHYTARQKIQKLHICQCIVWFHLEAKCESTEKHVFRKKSTGFMHQCF
jgi:hypothetical protein